MARSGSGKKTNDVALGFVDRVLTGENGRPVSVSVEFVDRRSDIYLRHNIENVTDFTTMDFFMPLLLLGAIFALQIVDYMRAGLFISVVLQVALWRDLFARAKRRPSSRRAVGWIPPFKSGDWGRSILIYLATLPFALGAGWLNGKLYIWLFPNSAFAIMKNLTQGPPMGAVVTLGIFWLLIEFFSLVVFAPVTEEMWFRGIGLASFMKTGGRLRAVFWTSLIFGLLHGPTRFFFSTVMGFGFAWVRLRTGSLHCSMAIHALHNCAVFVIALVTIYTNMPSWS